MKVQSFGVEVDDRVVGLDGGLKFSWGRANRKMKPLEKRVGRILTFSLPSGKTCPGALLCKAWVKEVDGVLVKVRGRETKFDCYSASLEALRRNVWEPRMRNRKLLGRLGRSDRIAAALISDLEKQSFVGVRLHIGGDFYSMGYLKAWIKVAERFDECVFYGYTKSLNLLDRLDLPLPQNLRLTASIGGRYDALVEPLRERYRLGTARVVLSEEEAKKLGLEIDHDDSHAWRGGEDFALLIHGKQRAGTEESRASWRNSREGLLYLDVGGR